MGGVTPRRGCRVGLSFSVTASVTLMRICLLAAPFRGQPGPHPRVFINDHCGSVWFGQLNKRLKKKHTPLTRLIMELYMQNSCSLFIAFYE